MRRVVGGGGRATAVRCAWSVASTTFPRTFSTTTLARLGRRRSGTALTASGTICRRSVLSTARRRPASGPGGVAAGRATSLCVARSSARLSSRRVRTLSASLRTCSTASPTPSSLVSVFLRIRSPTADSGPVRAGPEVAPGAPTLASAPLLLLPVVLSGPSARALGAPVLIAAPMPSATARAPTRPM